MQLRLVSNQPVYLWACYCLHAPNTIRFTSVTLFLGLLSATFADYNSPATEY
jgi:hypothetical protein